MTTVPFDFGLLEPARREAAQILEEQGHLPALGDARFSMALDTLVWESSNEASPTLDATPPERWLRTVPTDILHLDHGHAERDAVTRAVVSGWLYEKACAESEDSSLEDDSDDDDWADGFDDYDDDDDDDDDGDEPAPQPKPEALALLRSYLDSRSPTQIADEHLMWELQAAGCAFHVQRVADIAGQCVDRNSSALTLERAVRAVFWALTESGKDLGPSSWLAEWASSEEVALWDLHLLLAAVRDGRSSLGPSLRRAPVPAPPPAHEVDTLLRVNGWLERAGALRPMTLAQQAVAGWVEFRLGPTGREHFLEAAKYFAEVAGGCPQLLRDVFAEATAASHVRAGRADLAEPILAARLNAPKVEAEAAFELLLCCHLQGKEQETLAALDRYEALRGPSGDDDVLMSLALKFGLLAKERTNLHEFLAGAAMAAPGRQEGEAIVGWIDPWFHLLSPPARSKWWAGVGSLSVPAIEERLGDELWSQVATFFAESLNLEIRHRVFGPFALATLAWVRQFRQLKPPKEQLAILNGRGSLGQHLHCLQQVHAPADDFTSQLATWLATNHAALSSHLKDLRNREQLERLSRLRNAGTHGSAKRVDAHEVFRIARALMVLLVTPGKNVNASQ